MVTTICLHVLQVTSNSTGPTIAFNLKRHDGSWVGHKEVEKLASLAGIQLRVIIGVVLLIVVYRIGYCMVTFFIISCKREVRISSLIDSLIATTFLFVIFNQTGCFCNPGACSRYLGLSHVDLLSNVEVYVQLFTLPIERLLKKILCQ